MHTCVTALDRNSHVYSQVQPMPIVHWDMLHLNAHQLWK